MQPTSPTDEILDALGSLGRAVSRRTVGIVDPGSYWVLHTLDQSERTRMGELAARCYLDSSTISRHVRSLERRGLIRRTPDPDDGRAQLVALTDRGRETIRHARAERRRLLLDRLHTWPETDVNALLVLLQRLTDPTETEGPANPESDLDDTD